VSGTRFRARLSRVGAQTYPEGEQHRAPQDVFEPASLAGLDGLRVQLGHAVGARVVGRVVPGSVTHDASHVIATLEITDAATVLDIRSGRVREISLAYDCEIEVDSAGTQHQRKIRFTGPGAHVALLDSQRERARCGATCSIGAAQDGYMTTQRTSDGGAIITDVAATCGCRADATQVERDRIQAHLDHGAYVSGLSAVEIANEIAASGVDDINSANAAGLVRDAIATLARAGRSGNPYTPAVYHNGMRRSAAADSLSSDEAFRASLQRKLDSSRVANDDDAPAPAPKNVPTVASLTAQSAAETDEGFRQMLAAKLGGAE
jgi:hypothetical protein